MDGFRVSTLWIIREGTYHFALFHFGLLFGSLHPIVLSARHHRRRARDKLTCLFVQCGVVDSFHAIRRNFIRVDGHAGGHTARVTVNVSFTDGCDFAVVVGVTIAVAYVHEWCIHDDGFDSTSNERWRELVGLLC